MPHNVVLVAPGALAAVGLAAEQMAADPNAWSLGFVPDRPEVLAATRLVAPGETEVLRFDAPEASGDYPYLCTFPGHWARMNGTMHVRAALDASLAGPEDSEPETRAPATRRRFVRSWTLADLEPDLDRVSDASAERGRAVLEAASCLRCHATRGEGGTTGPDLAEVVQRRKRGDLLREILDPSREILAGYGAEILITTGGRGVAGRVLSEDGERLLVRADPYRPELEEIPLAEISQRARARVSTMPSELLSTFEREEILDLLAYLESL
jgi:putative heme-binding domain-containing protein